MKNLLNRWLLLFVLPLGMSALACNLPFGGEEEPTPRPTREADDAEEAEEEVEDEPEVMATEAAVVEATAVPEEPAAEPTAAAAEEENSLLVGLVPQSLIVRDTVQEFETLSSYQMDMTITTKVTETTQIINATMLVSTDPPQTQMTYSFEGVTASKPCTTPSMKPPSRTRQRSLTGRRVTFT